MNEELRSLSEIQAQLAGLGQLRAERDDRIATLVRYGRASVQEIIGATGLTKSRVYQIVADRYPGVEVDSK